MDKRTKGIEKQWEALEENGKVRLRIVPDEDVDLSYLDDPAVFTEEQKDKTIQRYHRDGACGVIGEYFDGERWCHADSCFGFIGDDWKGSGYDTDIKQTTMEALKAVKHCKACGQVIRGKEVS